KGTVGPWCANRSPTRAPGSRSSCRPRTRRGDKAGMKRLTALVLAVVLGASATACGRGHKLAKDEGRLVTTGQALVARPGKPFKQVGKSHLLRAGDRVEIHSGDARVELA